MPAINILGHAIPVEFQITDPAAHVDRGHILTSLASMAALINRIAWPPHYAEAFRIMTRIVFFQGTIMVDGYPMDRPCCDQDDAVFYWETVEYLLNMDDDVHANTFFHDCWHVVQFRAAGNKYAYEQEEQVVREVDAINHQIGVAHMLGCSDAEIAHLVAFRANHAAIVARLDEGTSPYAFAAHRPGAMSLEGPVGQG